MACYISSGVISTGISLSYNSMFISSGGVANSTTVNYWGSMHISSGGTANTTTVNKNGYMYISNGGVANSTTVNSSGYMHIESGGVANSTTVNSSGYMHINSGGVANSTTVNSDGWLYIYGGVANSTTVNSDGWLYIYGGVANSTTVNDWGYMSISSGGVANSTTVNDGGMHISSGGVANSTTVNDGGMHISSGGVANSTTVNHSGYMSISSGGVANSTTVNHSGDMYISSGGVANSTTVNHSGGMTISSGGVANSTTVNSGGWMTISSGGVANNTTVEGDYRDFYPGGGMDISSGGVANSTTVNSSGYMRIFRGGVANSTTVNSGGSMRISSGGVANSTTVNYGDMYISSGGVANSTTVNDWSSMYIESGGVANSTTVNGDMYLSSGGVANSTEVNDWGNMRISSGGVANSTTLNEKGYMYIEGGGMANETVLSGYSVAMYLSSGGVANSTTVKSGGDMYISNGGVANSTTVNSGGDMYISNGGVANSTTVNNWGWMNISSGGVVNSTTVNSGGCMYIWGGVANSTTVNSRGYMYIENGGTHRGSLQIESGAIISAYSGSIVDFDLSGRTENDDYLINDLSLISGMPSYTITISENQAGGTYKLAQVARAFNSVISIGNGSVYFGTLSVNGSPLEYNDVSYSLILSNGNLALSAAPKDKIAPELVITGNPADWTNQDVTLCASANEDNCVFQYSFDNSTWFSGNTVTVSENTTFYFKVTDAAGNVTEKSVVVDKIDKIAPTLNISGNATNWTNKDVVLSATANEGTIEYFNGSKWVATSTITATTNGTYKFRVTDLAGNVTEKSVVVDKIDKVAPTLNISGNATNWTNTDVVLTATANDGTIEYFNGSKWVSGNSITATANGTYKFRVTDAAGNMTEKSVVVDKIDKVAPTLEISGNASEWTNQDVILTASACDGKIEYFDGNDWVVGDTLTVVENGTYTFRVTDAAGNITEKSVVVDKLDKFAPEAPVAVLQNITETQQDLSVSITFSSDSVVKQYSVDQVNWFDCDSSVSAESNSVYYFKAVDVVGNISDTTQFIVSNYQVKTFCGGGVLVNHGSRIASAFLTERGVSAMYVSSGGLADATIVGSNAHLQVLSGGSAYATQIGKGAKLNVLSGAVVRGVTVSSGGKIEIASGGVVDDLTFKRYANSDSGEITQIANATVNGFTLESRCVAEASEAVLYNVNLHSAAQLKCFAGEEGKMLVSGAVVNSDAQLVMEKFAVASAVTVSKAATLKIQNGGSAYATSIDREGKFEMLGIAQHTVLNGGSMYIGDTAYHGYDGTGGMPTSNVYDEDIHAEDNVLNSSWLNVYSGGTATSNMVNSNSWLHTYYGGTATSNTINSSGYMTVHGSGTIDTTMVHSGGYLRLYAGAVLKGDTFAGGKVTVENAGTSATEDVVRAYGADIYFMVNERSVADDAIVTDMGMIMGATYHITVGSNQAGGTYKLADGAHDFSGSITIGTTNSVFGNLSVNGSSVKFNDTAYSLALSDGNLTLSVTPSGNGPVMTGDKNGVSFSGIYGNTCIEFSKDNFASVLAVEVDTNAVDTCGMPSGTYQWQVCTDGTCYQGDNIISDNVVTPQKFISDANGNTDLFFANANGVWENGYAAQHQGSGSWQGMRESVVLEGKNKIADVFTGSTDANVLVLTDTSNGDALFVDDIYTALGDQARLSQIDEIRAGAGNDIVDMTSQQFAYSGNGVKIYGGAGDDTIWANGENNTLFGDAGNDRLVGANGDDILIGGVGNDSMNGGGGNDTFCFGGNFGNDTVEQLSGGSVTLHFETGSNANWNAETLTYTDGANSVTVSGVTDVTLVFGEPAPVEGAFLDAASEKIFEDKNKGMIA